MTLLLVLALVAAACGSSTPPPSSAPTDRPFPSGSPAANPTAGVSPLPSSSLAPTDPASPEPTQTPEITPSPSAPPGAVRMPFVPVVNFWSTRRSIPLDELRAAWVAGDVRASAADLAALADAFGVPAPGSAQVADAAAVVAAVKGGAMGILRATDVQPSVRALGIGGVGLFGNDRIDDISQWPLTAEVESDRTWDQSASWTLVSAGDIMGDRGVRTAFEASGRGPGYLLDGGTSKVVRLKCCSFFGYTYPVVTRTGNSGVVRQMFRDADFAMANLETGVLPDAPFHGPTSFTFTTDPSVVEVLGDAGFDLLSNANNHSKNGGTRALRTALDTLDQLGILPAGAGVGPEEAAQPSIAEVNGVTLAVIACDAIARGFWAKPGKLGTNSCKDGSVARTIREIRDQVDAIIVFPHWGIEYELPAPYQYELSDEWFDAGADMIIGAHSHFPGAIYEYNGRVAMFSMGNFIFDQDFRQTTLMGLVVETTWNGNRPVQIWPHPLLNVDAQPNFADPDTDGQWAYDIMKWQSRRLDWGGTPHPFTGYPYR